jgi:hypothetical protein
MTQWTVNKVSMSPPKGAKKEGPDESGLTVHLHKGRVVRWEWVVTGDGERGRDYRDVDPGEGMHRGHVMSCQEGAQDTWIADSEYNIVPQTPTVNLSNVKRFENWRSENALDCTVVVVQPEANGMMTFEIKDSDPPIKTTFDPMSDERFPDGWFFQPGPWPQ